MKYLKFLFYAWVFLYTNPLQSHSFLYSPPQPITLVKGLGNLSHPVTTSVPQAQAFFNQGLTLIYAFNHDAAYWSFQKAAELDSKMPMAYWGMALALGPNINMDIDQEREQKAYELIQKALLLSADSPPNEKDYIQALSKRYSNEKHPDLKLLAIQYNQAMKALVEKYPYDLDAATLYAESSLNLNPWHQWDNSGEPLKGTLEIVALLEHILKWDPNHLGANHYYIHAIEASKHPERALMSAQRLRDMLPASGHILHMPTHICILVGDYHMAALCNEKAVKADQDYIRKFGLDGIYPVHYMSHNLYFLSRAYALEGRFSNALRAAEELRCFYSPHFFTMPDLEYYEPAVLFTLLRFHRWNEILDLKAPVSEMKISTLLWHFGKSMAYSALGDVKNAQTEQKIFLEEKFKIPDSTKFGYNQAKNVLQLAEYQLNAKIAEMNNDSTLAIEWLSKAVDLQDQLYYNEPPDWYFPLRESLGALLLKDKQYQKAERVFNTDLEKHPLNGRSLFGLWKSLEAQAKHADAYWIKQEFDTAWKYSDTPLTIQDL